MRSLARLATFLLLATEVSGDAAATDDSSPSLSSEGDGRADRSAHGRAHQHKHACGHVQRPKLPFATALRAARPWSFPATVSPVLLGAVLAFQEEGTFNPLLLGFTLVTTLAVHAAGNLMNTLFDFRNGFDSPGSSDLTLVKGVLQPEQVGELIGKSYLIAALSSVPICLLSPAPLKQLLPLLGAGATSAFVYTGGPGLKYKALGDVLISSTFGPLLVGFAFLVQTGGLSYIPLLGSLPLAAHTEAILHANNARDMDDDRANGVYTLSGFLGRRASVALYAGLIVAPFAGVVRHAWSRSVCAALPLLAAPRALGLMRDFRAGVLARMPMRTAKFQFLFASLLTLGALVPAPPLAALVRTAMSR